MLTEYDLRPWENRKRRISLQSFPIWTWGRTSSFWGWWSPGSPEKFWSLLLWRYSRPTWTRSCAACSKWPCFGRGVGLDNPQRSLPTPNFLRFCDSAIVSSGFDRGLYRGSEWTHIWCVLIPPTSVSKSMFLCIYDNVISKIKYTFKTCEHFRWLWGLPNKRLKIKLSQNCCHATKVLELIRLIKRNSRKSVWVSWT